jgi:hypothetical protein
MTQAGRLNGYTEIHKGVRRALFETEMLLGAVDWTDPEAIPEVAAAWHDLAAFLRLHVENELAFVHPIYERLLPGVARSLNADHEEQEADLTELDAHFDRVLAMPADAGRVALGLELYRCFSQFIADYLPHLLREEAVYMRNLWDLCTEEEIANLVATIIAAETPEDAILSGKFILRAANPQDLISLMGAITGRVPPEVIEGMNQLAQQVLPAEKLQKLAPPGPG